MSGLRERAAAVIDGSPELCALWSDGRSSERVELERAVADRLVGLSSDHPAVAVIDAAVAS